MTQTQTQAKGDSLFRKKLKELVGPSNVQIPKISEDSCTIKKKKRGRPKNPRTVADEDRIREKYYQEFEEDRKDGN